MIVILVVIVIAVVILIERGGQVVEVLEVIFVRRHSLRKSSVSTEIYGVRKRLLTRFQSSSCWIAAIHGGGARLVRRFGVASDC